MSSQVSRVAQYFVLSSIGEWLTALSLVFGGCCSNALALELITTYYAPAGTLITFAQFLLITMFGLRKQLVIVPSSITRNEALELISTQIIKLIRGVHNEKCVKVALTGLDNVTNTAFTDDLFAWLKNKHLRTSVQYSHCSESSDTTDAPRLFRIQSSSSQAGDSGSTPLSPSTNNAIVQTTSENITIFCCDKTTSFHSHGPYNFAIYLQTSSSLGAPAVEITVPYTVVDVTQPSHPIILHPFNRTFLPNLLRIRFKRPHIPLSRYLVQVVLFLLVNLLNNAAFAYQIPMAVHIIFRSGGLVVNLIMGWLLERRRYSVTQVISVFLVTIGVALTTLSSMQSKPHRSPRLTSSSVTTSSGTYSYLTYATGIFMLSIALVLSGFLGLLQDRAFSLYGRGNWEESMFYLHALALPMFAVVGPDLSAQIKAANAGPKVDVGLHTITQPLYAATGRPIGTPAPTLPPLPFISFRPSTLWVPAFYVPLLLNVFTQLLCVSGVNRLTSRVNSLTVSLVLVVRKAVSLAISVLLLGNSKGNTLLWAGAAAVLVGTVGYTMGSRKTEKKKSE